MTKQEIIDKINTGIRGQGSMVDIGGVLADVLTGIVDNITTPVQSDWAESDAEKLSFIQNRGPLYINDWGDDGGTSERDKDGFCRALEITPDQLDALMALHYTMVKVDSVNYNTGNNNGHLLVWDYSTVSYPKSVLLLTYDESDLKLHETLWIYEKDGLWTLAEI